MFTSDGGAAELISVTSRALATAATLSSSFLIRSPKSVGSFSRANFDPSVVAAPTFSSSGPPARRAALFKAMSRGFDEARSPAGRTMKEQQRSRSPMRKAIFGRVTSMSCPTMTSGALVLLGRLKALMDALAPSAAAPWVFKSEAWRDRQT